jgi:hypothetical protein
MNHFVVFAVSYLVTGFWRIRQDFKQDFHNRPAYTRDPGRYMVGFSLMLLTWPIIVYQEVRIHRSLARAFLPILILSALMTFGFWLNP